MTDYVTLRLTNEEGFHKSILGTCEKDVAMNFLAGFKMGRQMADDDSKYDSKGVLEFVMGFREKKDIWFKGLTCGFENKVGTVEVIADEE